MPAITVFYCSSFLFLSSGPPVKIEVNMYLKSMGPVSETDEVWLPIIIIISFNNTSLSYCVMCNCFNADLLTGLLLPSNVGGQPSKIQ